MLHILCVVVQSRRDGYHLCLLSCPLAPIKDSPLPSVTASIPHLVHTRLLRLDLLDNVQARIQEPVHAVFEA